jgi:hypothetical protein
MVDMIDRRKFEQLYSARQKAQNALNAHFARLRIAIGYGDPLNWEWLGRHPDWLGEHRRLQDERDSAEERLFRYLQSEEV